MTTTLTIVKDVIARIFNCDEADVSLDTRLINDLGGDSLDIIDLNYTLGKALGVRMPVKTVLIHGIELCGDENKLVINDRLTAMGSRFLVNCPNKYDVSKVVEGTSLVKVFENTNVMNWFNLCDAILQSPNRDGDALFREYAEEFVKNLA